MLLSGSHTSHSSRARFLDSGLSAATVSPPYPSIGVLGRFIVVPEAQARNALGSVEADRDHVVQPRREGDQPHVLTLHCDVGPVD